MKALVRTAAISVLLVTALAGAAGDRSGASKPTVPPPPVSVPTTAPSPDPTPATDPPPTPSKPRVNPDRKHPKGDLIEISIAKQRLTAWREGRVVMRLIISTGRPGYRTPKGHYKILEKYTNRWSYKWRVWMPYAMRWYNGYFIHQLPHYPGSSHHIGASKLGTPDSHGCVRVNLGDAARLFRWTKVGTPVWVH